MSLKPRINRIKFLSIARDIKEHPFDSQTLIASRHNVSQGTVSKVNRTSGWGNFLVGKDTRYSISQKVKLTALASVLPTQPLGLTPKLKTVTQQFEADLKQLEASPTRDEFDSAVREIHSRMDAIMVIVRTKRTSYAPFWKR